MVFDSLLAGENNLAEARSHITFAIGNQFHKQNAVDTGIRRRDTNTGSG